MDGNPMSSELSSFLSVIVGLALCCSVVFNIWLCVKRYRDENQELHLSPFLLSSCCSDLLLTCISGATICVLVSRSSWTTSKAICIILDVLFLALLWSTTLSYLIYNLDRHCLIAARGFYPETFGKFRRNAVTISLLWIIAIALALLYIAIRPDAGAVPMTFLFTSNMLYCFFAIIVLDLLPIVIIIGCLVKVTITIKRRKSSPKSCIRGVVVKPANPIAEDIQSFNGTLVSSTLFILSSSPWTVYQILKTLKLNRNGTVFVEIILLSVLVCGIGFKSAMYVLCCGFLRRKLFSKFIQQSGEFTLQQPAVITNMAAV